MAQVILDFIFLFFIFYATVAVRSRSSHAERRLFFIFFVSTFTPPSQVILEITAPVPDLVIHILCSVSGAQLRD